MHLLTHTPQNTHSLEQGQTNRSETAIQIKGNLGNPGSLAAQ